MVLLQTVQTSWRPQHPLPKEIANHMDKHIQNINGSAISNATNHTKKWSIGKFFRRKKKAQLSDGDSSSEEDRKAGFNPPKRKTKSALKHTIKLVGGFDHIVVTPQTEAIQQMRDYDRTRRADIVISPLNSSNASNSLDRRLRKERIRAARLYGKEGCSGRGRSSDEDVHSHNSGSIKLFRSDESLGEHSGSGNKKSRSARTERYLKRISRTDDLLTPQLAQRNQRWQTNPVVYTSQNSVDHLNHVNDRPCVLQPHSSIKSLTSISSAPSQQLYNYSLPDSLNHKFSLKSSNPIINYENYINRRLTESREFKEKSPPLPPPRNPQRRVKLNPQEPRPLSYAFDKSSINSVPITNTVNSRCVSDERLWGPKYITQLLPQRPSSAQSEQPSTTTIINDYQKHEPVFSFSYKAAPKQDIKYVTDATPRSRRPIHIVKDESQKEMPEFMLNHLRRNLNNNEPSAFSFVKPSDKPLTARRTLTNQISLLSDEFLKRKISPPIKSNVDPNLNSNTVDPNHNSILKKLKKNSDSNNNDLLPATIVTGNLIIKPQENSLFQTTIPRSSINTGTKRDIILDKLKTNSMPNYYSAVHKEIQSQAMNKYEEHVAKKVLQQPLSSGPPVPPQRRTFMPKRKFSNNEHRQSTNLEDAINELEAIYESLKLSDEGLLDRAERRDFPQSHLLGSHKEFYGSPEQDNDDDRNCEPDVIHDDVVYRNFKHANNIPKILDTQLPFGIPIGPIPPSPITDYLHIPANCPVKSMFIARKRLNVISDDMAVRNLRKDDPNYIAPKVDHLIIDRLGKKQRAQRSMSANIYNLIQRDAAKPSGGSIEDYLVLDQALSKARSLKDLSVPAAEEHPSMLHLLQREKRLNNYQKTSEKVGGAVFNLPSTLVSTSASKPFVSNNSISYSKPPVPLPRSNSLSPDMNSDQKDIEQMLNAIAKEAKESSEKLSRDLLELQKVKGNLPSTHTNQFNDLAKMKLEDDIDNVSRAAQRCQTYLNDCFPPDQKLHKKRQISPLRKLRREDKILDDITDVAKAACVFEKVLTNVVDAKIYPGKKQKVRSNYVIPASSLEINSINQNDRKIINIKTNYLENNNSLIENIKLNSSNQLPKSENLSVENKARKKLPITIDEKNHTRQPYKNDTKLESLCESLTVRNSISSLLEKLEPESKKIGTIAERCMRQLTHLGDLHTKIAGKNAMPSISPRVFDNQQSKHKNEIESPPLQKRKIENQTNALIELYKSKQFHHDEIDKIMEECSVEAKKKYLPISSTTPTNNHSSEEELNILLLPPSVTSSYEKNPMHHHKLSSAIDEQRNKSSSDYGAKSSPSDTLNRPKSNSLTSFNALSSSDFVKSLSSSCENHMISGDLKSSSTTSHYAQSTSSTPGNGGGIAQPMMASTNISPSSPMLVQQKTTLTCFTNHNLQTTAVAPTLTQKPSIDGNGSQYNSADELAMIFGTKSSTSESAGKHGVNTFAATFTTTTSTISTTTTTTTTTDVNAVVSLTHLLPACNFGYRIDACQPSMMDVFVDEDSTNAHSKLNILIANYEQINNLDAMHSSSSVSGIVSLNDLSVLDVQEMFTLPTDSTDKYPFINKLIISAEQVTSDPDHHQYSLETTITLNNEYKNEVFIPLNQRNFELFRFDSADKISEPLSNIPLVELLPTISGIKRIHSNNNSTAQCNSLNKNTEVNQLNQTIDSTESIQLSRRRRTLACVPFNNINCNSQTDCVKNPKKNRFTDIPSVLFSSQNIILACSICCLANNDLFITLIIIIIAVLTILACKCLLIVLQ